MTALYDVTDLDSWGDCHKSLKLKKSCTCIEISIKLYVLCCVTSQIDTIVVTGMFVSIQKPRNKTRAVYNPIILYIS